MKVKICGMKESANIEEILMLKPDVLGFIFYEKSPRYIRNLPDGIDYGETKKAGVFVNETEERIMEIANENNLDILQLHGDETPVLCRKLKKKGFEIFKAFSVSENFDFERSAPYLDYVDMFIFDAKGKSPGGNGIVYDWSILHRYKYDKGFLLSGGLSPYNLLDVKHFRHSAFAGIDLNSGFEDKPGIKNYELLKSFLDEIRS